MFCEEETMSLKDFWSKPAAEQNAIAEQAVPKVVNPCIRVVMPENSDKAAERAIECNEQQQKGQ